MGKIIVAHGERVKIAKLFDVSTVTVKSALNEVTKSELAARIRKIAIDRGGHEVKPSRDKNIDSDIDGNCVPLI